MIEGGGAGRRSCFVGDGAVGVDGVLKGDGWILGPSKGYLFLEKHEKLGITLN